MLKYRLGSLDSLDLAVLRCRGSLCLRFRLTTSLRALRARSYQSPITSRHAMTIQLQFNLQPERRTFTVSELTARIRDLLNRNFTDIFVEGEISNCREAQSGHVYCRSEERRVGKQCRFPFGLYLQHSTSGNSSSA